MGLFDKKEKKFCMGCGQAIKAKGIVEQLKQEPTGNVEFADGWYCPECSIKKRSNFKNKK